MSEMPTEDGTAAEMPQNIATRRALANVDPCLVFAAMEKTFLRAFSTKPRFSATMVM